MLTIEFMVGSFGTASVIGITIGYQILAFKKSVEVSTSG